MEEKSKNDFSLENNKIENDPIVYLGIHEEIEKSTKRVYDFDNSENRNKISIKIDETFDIPLVKNFNSRQEQLAEEMDRVRDGLYDVKMEIEKIDEEIKNLNQPSLDSHSTMNKSQITNNSIKKNIDTIKTESASVHLPTPAKKKENISKNPLTVSTQKDGKSNMTKNLSGNILNANINIDSKKKESDSTQSAKKRPVTVNKETPRKIEVHKSEYTNKSPIKNKNEEKLIEKKEIPKTPAKKIENVKTVNVVKETLHKEKQEEKKKELLKKEIPFKSHDTDKKTEIKTKDAKPSNLKKEKSSINVEKKSDLKNKANQAITQAKKEIKSVVEKSSTNKKEIIIDQIMIENYKSISEVQPAENLNQNLIIDLVTPSEKEMIIAQIIDKKNIFSTEINESDNIELISDERISVIKEDDMIAEIKSDDKRDQIKEEEISNQSKEVNKKENDIVLENKLKEIIEVVVEEKISEIVTQNNGEDIINLEVENKEEVIINPEVENKEELTPSNLEVENKEEFIINKEVENKQDDTTNKEVENKVEDFLHKEKAIINQEVLNKVEDNTNKEVKNIINQEVENKVENIINQEVENKVENIINQEVENKEEIIINQEAEKKEEDNINQEAEKKEDNINQEAEKKEEDNINEEVKNKIEDIINQEAEKKEEDIINEEVKNKIEDIINEQVKCKVEITTTISELESNHKLTTPDPLETINQHVPILNVDTKEVSSK